MKPRKPFEPFNFMVHGVPSQDVVGVMTANRAIAQDEIEYNKVVAERAELKETLNEENKQLRARLADAERAVIIMCSAIDMALTTVDIPGAREHVGISLENAREDYKAYLAKYAGLGKGGK